MMTCHFVCLSKDRVAKNKKQRQRPFGRIVETTKQETGPESTPINYQHHSHGHESCG